MTLHNRLLNWKTQLEVNQRRCSSRKSTLPRQKMARVHLERLEARLAFAFGASDGAYIVEPWPGQYIVVKIQPGDLTSMERIMKRFLWFRFFVLLALVFAFGTDQPVNAGGCVLTDLGTLGGTSSQANAINSTGDIVGDSDTKRNAATHAFLRTAAGRMTDLGTLDPTFSGANSCGRGINAFGQVTGIASTSGALMYNHAFRSNGSPGGMIDLGTLGGNESNGRGINGAGQVVGSSTVTGNTATHAFLSNGSPGGMIYLNTQVSSGCSGWVLIYVSGINDRGQIAGMGTVNGTFHAFLLTPAN